LVARVAVAALIGVSAGCASSASTQAGTRTTHDATNGAATPTSASAIFTATANTLLRQVGGCGDPPLLSRQQLASTPSLHRQKNLIATVTSAASCSLRGQGVLVLAFTDAGSQAAAQTDLRSFDGYFSYGPGWVAVPTTTEVAVSGLSAVQDVAATLGGTIGFGKPHG
jgi:hypothetical protein